MEYILNLSKGLGKLFQKEFNKFFIGKAKIEFFNSYNGGIIIIKSEITKDLIKLKKCRAYILENGNRLCKIELTLVKKINREVRFIEKQSDVKGKYFCKINREEIYGFSKDTGDLNEIHFLEKPIVQGMILIKYLDEYFKTLEYEYTSINIRFIQPLYSDESTSIILESKDFMVYKDNKLILKGSIE